MQILMAFTVFFVVGGAVFGVLWLMKDVADKVEKESNEEE